MEVFKAEVLGFCSGVRRAVEMALALEGGDAVTFGPLVHNDQVQRRLRETGIGMAGKVEEAAGCDRIVIRTHGIPPATEKALEALGAALVDGTCPVVKRSQRLAAEAAEQGKQVVIVGDPGHSEVLGIAGYAGDRALPFPEKEPWPLEQVEQGAVVLAQTTISRSDYEAACDAIGKTVSGAVFHSTICSATEKRQQAVRSLAPRCDAFLVIGGAASSNTGVLTRIAGEVCAYVWQIESPDQIPAEIYGFRKVGISAGASTPDWIIEAVIEALDS